MKAKELATLMLRLVGIYCLIQAISHATLFINLIIMRSGVGGSAGSDWALELSLMPGILLGSIGVILFVFAPGLGNWLMPEASRESVVAAIAYEDWQRLLIAAVGALIFAGALPQLPAAVAAFLNLSEDSGFQRLTYAAAGAYGWTVAAGTIAKALLGFAMFVRPRLFIRLCGG